MAGFSGENLAAARQMVAVYPQARSALIPLCHLAQAQEGWLTPDLIEEIAGLCGVTAAEVRGTASFYDMLHTEPVGTYVVGVCTNISCMLGGAYELLDHATERLGVAVGGTTPDGTFTLEETECTAGCDSPPCLTVNYRYFLGLTNDGFDGLIGDLEAGRRTDEVPPHGVLTRVARDGALRVGRDTVVAERAKSDEMTAQRKAAAS